MKCAFSKKLLETADWSKFLNYNLMEKWVFLWWFQKGRILWYKLLHSHLKIAIGDNFLMSSAPALNVTIQLTLQLWTCNFQVFSCRLKPLSFRLAQWHSCLPNLFQAFSRPSYQLPHQQLSILSVYLDNSSWNIPLEPQHFRPIFQYPCSLGKDNFSPKSASNSTTDYN